MNVIGRAKELELIKEIYASRVPELIAVWGRRRIGKTYLIRNGRRHHDGAYFEITGQKDSKQHLQLSHFQDVLSKTFLSGQKIEKIKNWTEAFRSLQSAITFAEKDSKLNKPITIFFDEVAWLDSRRSGFLNALEHFWNSWASNQANVKIFVCSSASSWIVSKILKGKGGWHRRATRRIHLKPFSLAETKVYLESKNINLSIHDLLSLYMILGGTAAYLDQIKRGSSLPTIVNSLFLDENGTRYCQMLCLTV
jgi:AAA+ ATPase superfamily predicted ATPase